MPTLTVTNPYNNEVLKELELLSTREIRSLVEKAKEAQKNWAGRSLYERSCILYRFISVYDNNREKLAGLMTKEMGKPISQCRDEVFKVPQNIRGTIEYANHLYGQVLPDNDSDTAHDLVFTKRLPLGLIGCIIPFNYPVELTILKIIPALVMGNAVIVKAPSSNPLSVLLIGQLLVEAGVPKDIVPFIVCERTASNEAIIKNPKVDALALTGSTEAGIQLVLDSARCLKPLFLELGGNDPFVICHDADTDVAVKEMIGGRLFVAGQTCCAPKRFLVHRKISDQLADKLIERLKKTVTGDPASSEVELGTLISEKAAMTVEKQVAETVEEGAILAYGGQRKGAFFEPTVLKEVKRNMKIASDMEIFGPVFPIIPFDTEDEAIEIANQSSYALNAGVLSRDIMRAFHIANKLEAGSVVVNGHSAYRHIDQAHGGNKMSGIGREGISTSLEEFSRIKSYVLKDAFLSD
jgi:succinate-semialdehyde dehydrogenase/glutarate-semialdehyde dehydrogenase